MSDVAQDTTPPHTSAIGEQLKRPTTRHPSHTHAGRGIRIDATSAPAERTHYHFTVMGVSGPASNVPGHRHQLPNGQWSAAGIEGWSSAGVKRL